MLAYSPHQHQTWGHAWQETSGVTRDPIPHRTGKTKPELIYIQIYKLLPSPDHNSLRKKIIDSPFPWLMRLLYQRAVTQRCSSGPLSALAVSCKPQSLKRSAQTPTWQTDAVWLLRHRHSFWLCCTPMGGQGLAAGRAASLRFLKYLFSNNWTCFLTYTVRTSMGLDWLGLGRLEGELLTCLKCSVWDKLKALKVPRRRRVGRDFVDTSDYISTQQLFCVHGCVVCV